MTRPDVEHPLRRDVLAVDVETEGGILDDLSVEDDDQVVPLALFDQVWEPHSDTAIPAELRLPVAACNNI